MIAFAFFRLKRRIQKFLWSPGSVIVLLPVVILCFSSSFNGQIEKLYYNLRIFERLSKWFVFAGSVFLLVSLMRFQFRNRFKKVFSILEQIFQWGLWLGFLVFTIGLGIRWILAGHAPWSNRYESMIFGAWAILLAGIILARHSRLPVICGSLFSGIVLFMANTPSIDSAISSLPPVLKSKWLILHVFAALVSYGFFTVGTVLASFNLLVLAFTFSKKENCYLRKVSKLSKITEQSLWIGFLLIIMGNVLGAIWANVTWGTYWGWDPKESWALIVVLSYAMLLLLRFVLRSSWKYWLNVWALPVFGTVLMTYFGVNRFFTGMHSYGGEKAQFPSAVFWFAGIWILLSLLAYRNRNRI